MPFTRFIEDTARVELMVTVFIVNVDPCRLIMVALLSLRVELTVTVFNVAVDPRSVEKKPAPSTMLLVPMLDVVTVEPVRVEKKPTFRYMDDTVIVEVTAVEPVRVE